MGAGGDGVGAAPTGCYKCGRSGHWSWECTSSGPPDSTNQTPTTDSNPNSKPASSSFGVSEKPKSDKPVKLPKKRLKLTPELLVSDDGLGYILRHFPRHFKFHGQGHEVDDLGNLINLYSQWHSHVLPKFHFDHFVQKVEQLGTTRHVKMCLRELKERIANGGDPTKLHESPAEPLNSNHNQGDVAAGEDLIPEEPNHVGGNSSLNGDDAIGIAEEILDEVYEKVTEARSTAIKINEEQRARMEANRLKALQKASEKAPL